MTSRVPFRSVRIGVAAAALFGPPLVHESVAHAAIELVEEARLDAVGSLVTKRAVAMTPDGVNRQDCDDDQRIRFALRLSDFEANAAFQAWVSPAGADCSIAAARVAANASCWQLSPGIPLTSTMNLDVPVRTLISGAPPFSPSARGDASKVCGAVDSSAIAVHFLYFAPGALDAATWVKTVEILVDTVGPARPPEPSVTVSEDSASVRLSWEPGVVVANSRIYCAPVDANGPCSLADFSTASGEPATPTTNFAASFECASVAGHLGNGASVQQTPRGPLESGRRYIFARATDDFVGNLSPLSPPVCATVPAPPDAVGGGGSSCSASTSGAASATTPFALLAVLGLFIARRRRS